MGPLAVGEATVVLIRDFVALAMALRLGVPMAAEVVALSLCRELSCA
jgi:hypothetical protein